MSYRNRKRIRLRVLIALALVAAAAVATSLPNGAVGRAPHRYRCALTFRRNATRWLKKTLCGYAPAGSLWA
jgi:hypothetical protein